VIERRDAVASHEQERVVYGIEITHFAASEQRNRT